jgi:hypothetical protein
MQSDPYKADGEDYKHFVVEPRAAECAEDAKVSADRKVKMREEMRELLLKKEINIINLPGENVTLENADDHQLLAWMEHFYGPSHYMLWGQQNKESENGT